MSQQSTFAYCDIPGFEGYRVGGDGSVWTRWTRRHKGKRGGYWAPDGEWRLLASSPDKAGRPCVSIKPTNGDHQTIRTCKLVLLAFVGPCPPGMEACHENGDPADNRIENLSWGTHTDNMADRIRHGRYTRGSAHFNAKLTEADVVLMRQLRAEGMSFRKLAERFGISSSTVLDIIQRKWWKHI